MTKVKAAVILSWLAILLEAAPGHAQFYGQTYGTGTADNIEGFTVVGKGYVGAKPNSVEIDLEVSASSELTADAIVKYRDARKKLTDAFAGLKLPNISVVERGLLVDQKGQMQNPYMFMGMGSNSRAKTEVQLSRKLVVKATDIRQMEEEKLLQEVSRLLDVAQDAGAKIGNQNNFNPYYYRYNYMETMPGLIRFVLDDFDKLEEEAYEKAIADARTRAERLAKLSKVELGPIVAVREVATPGERAPNADGEAPRKRLEASKFQEIPVRVELMVRFEIRSKPDAKGRPAP
jgi:uncharacterized protein